MDKFTAAYIECALWLSTEDCGGHDQALDENYGIEDLAPEAIKTIEEDCADFQTTNAELLSGVDSEQAGHDFWLTRNRHGTGFWDRELGKIGQQLTEMAHAYGSQDLYVGDDGKIYVN